ncbi:MAG: NUDIX hydrolase [Cyclobacteriaceae bacterium]
MQFNQRVLQYLKRVQAMAKTGLAYAQDPYDIERYEELRDSTNTLLSDSSNQNLEDISYHFEKLDPYPTPKVDVRGLILKQGKVLLIQEISDQQWALPGGWCDIGFSPSENIIKEAREESGFEVAVDRFLAIWDKSKHDHPEALEYVYKLCFLCSITGGQLNPGHEALDAAFFDIDQLPPLSLHRNTESQIQELCRLAESGGVVFD